MARSMLFTPFEMKGVTLPNRVVVSPMGQYSADGKGNATDWHLMHLGNLAISGAGLVLTEATAVEARGRVSPYCLGIWSDENAASLERVVDFCRKQGGAKLGMQLAHAGRKGGVSTAWEGQRPLETHEGGWEIISPSAVAYPGRAMPRAADVQDLKAIKDAFVAAAKRADALGFDAIEVHNAHGYLLHSFLTPFANTRNDEYGGDRKGRMRFPLENFAAVRAVWPENKVLGIRLSTTDWAPGGWDIEDTLEFCERLKELGADYVVASSGGSSADQQIAVGPSYQVPHAAEIKRHIDIPVMAVGLITEAKQAESILRTGQADMIALGRGMLYDPRWAWHAAHDLGDEAYFPRQYERCHPKMRSLDFLKPRSDDDAKKREAAKA